MNVATHILGGLLVVFAAWNTATSHAQRLVQVEDAPRGSFPTRVGPSPDSVFENPFARNRYRAHLMLHGSCKIGNHFGGSRYLDRSKDPPNVPLPITSEQALSTKGFYLLAQPEVTTMIGHRKGMRLVLVNATSDDIAFEVCDNRLSIVQQAIDRSGKWKTIEILHSSLCGNSYYDVTLSSGMFLAFSVPRYSGTFSTTLRFCLLVNDFRSEVAGVSNEFPGSVNDAQFFAH